ncbi:MAG: hypothetical protein QXL22_06135 [Candidatus Nezhaarchaeales archaeon]
MNVCEKRVLSSWVQALVDAARWLRYAAASNAAFMLAYSFSNILSHLDLKQSEKTESPSTAFRGRRDSAETPKRE